MSDRMFCVCFFIALAVVIAAVAACVIFIPHVETWIHTDTGYSFKVEKTSLFISGYSVDEETRVIKVKESDGTRRYYEFNEWYRVEQVVTESLYEQWKGER